jgi:hypothetical protein
VVKQPNRTVMSHHEEHEGHEERFLERIPGLRFVNFVFFVVKQPNRTVMSHHEEHEGHEESFLERIPGLRFVNFVSSW